MKFSVNHLKEWIALSETPTDIAKYLTQLGLEVDSVSGEGDNAIIDIDLTPNRGDCLSVSGIATDLAAIFPNQLTPPSVSEVTMTRQDVCPVKMSHAGCPVLMTQVATVNVAAQLPAWMVERLTAAGMTAVNPVVDILNYVMITLGQPLHAYDRDKLSDNGLTVRAARDQETVTILGGLEKTLNPQIMVIADSKQVHSVAGIIGAQDSAVSEKTKTVVLESAWFKAPDIANRARQLGLSTDAAYRFERHVTPGIQAQALQWAGYYLQTYCQAELGPIQTHWYADCTWPKPTVLNLPKTLISERLGWSIEEKTTVQSLEALGFELICQGDHWQVTVPMPRADVTLPEDCVEEVARVIGYDQMPEKMPRFAAKALPCSETVLTHRQLSEVLINQGYQEVITYSFVDPIFQAQCDALAPMTLMNPISQDKSVMRTTLLPGLLQTVAYNQNRQQHDLALFEMGLTFRKENKVLSQNNYLAGVRVGRRYDENWNIDTKATVDFFDIKGDVEQLLKAARQTDYRFEPLLDTAQWHPGQAARIMMGEVCVGHLGALHPKLLKSLKIAGPVYAFECDVNGLKQAKQPEGRLLSRFPAVRRDLAWLLKTDVPVSILEEATRTIFGDWLKNIRIFDIYTGEGVANGYRSVAMGIVIQHPTRTLEDGDIDTGIQRLMQHFQTTGQAILRE